MTIKQDPTHPTGISHDTPRGNSDVARARERKARAALELRREGLDWDEIAAITGFPSGHSCLVATEKALENELRTGESKEFMRNLAGQRLDKLLKSVWSKATDTEHPEQYAAFDRARATIADYRKLYGLDAPTEMVVHNPSAAELEKWVATVINHDAPALEEADIFDIDVVEDSSVLNEVSDAAPAE